MSSIERVLAKADVRGEDECWIWQAAKTCGYGVVYWRGAPRRAHRVIYAALVGEIGDKTDLHHVCANRACVNPAHLQQLSRRDHFREEARRLGRRLEPGAKCSRGHDLTTETAYYWEKADKWRCHRCDAANARTRRAKVAA